MAPGRPQRGGIEERAVGPVRRGAIYRARAIYRAHAIDRAHGMDRARAIDRAHAMDRAHGIDRAPGNILLGRSRGDLEVQRRIDYLLALPTFHRWLTALLGAGML